jgi:hypothetical protein
MTTEKIYVQIDNDKIELTGDDKQAFLDQRKIDNAADLVKKTEAEAKAAEKAALLERLGITEDEARLLLG